LHNPRNGDLYHSCGAAYVGNTKAGKNIFPIVQQDAPSDGSQETFRSVVSELVSTFGSGLNVVSRDHSDDSSGSFGDTDPGTERNWYGNLDSCNHSSLSIPMFIPTLSDADRSFEAHLQSYDGPDCARPAKFDVEHTNWTQSMAVNLPAPYNNIPETDDCHATNILDQSQSTRSLASTTSLNINEFNLFDNPSFDISSDTGNASANSIFDALNPNGLGPILVTSPSSSQSFLRAFAPSPAEREVLQKALSSSTNASLERLASLSTVGSLPSSPTGTHVHGLLQHSHSLRDLSSFLPTWLKTFPRSGTVKFSPWEDEELRNGDQLGTKNATVTVMEQSTDYLVCREPGVRNGV
jgi:hypothetical protein